MILRPARTFYVFFLIVLLLLPVTGRAEEAPAASSCTPVVQLFGETICAEYLAEAAQDDPALQAMTAAQKEEVGARLMERRRARLGDLIWQQALAHKFGAQALQPTEEEIKNYRHRFEAAMESGYAADKKTASFITGLLAANKYSAGNENNLRALLNAVETSIKFYENRRAHRANLPPDYQFVIDAAEREVAVMMLSSWKADKLLYDAYGGAVVYDGISVMPVDAYQKFLSEIKKEKNLSVLDTAYQNPLAVIEEKIAHMRESAVETENNLVKNYFTDPSWQLSLGNSEQRFEALKAQLTALPIVESAPEAVAHPAQ